MSALAVLILGLAGAGSAQAGFVPALGSPFSYPAPTGALAVADSDRNGTVDVVSGALTLRRGAGTGFLHGPIALGSISGVGGVAAADLDGDGWLDYVATAAGADPGDPRRLVRFRAVPGGGYVQDTVLPDAGAAGDVTVGHVNGDGLPDIVFVRDDADPNVTVILGGATVADEYRSGIDASSGPTDVALGDLTGDGLPEIVVAGRGNPNLSVLRNEGGTFADGEPVPMGGSIVATRIALAQLDGDGRWDLLATDAPFSVISMLGSGGGLQQSQSIPSGLMTNPVSTVAAGDVNGDGHADVITGGVEGGIAVQLGNGTGGLRSPPEQRVYFPTGTDAPVREIAVADMNRDGQLDVVTANSDNSVSVLLNDETGLLSAAPARVGFGRMLPATGLRTRTVTLRANRGRLRITRLERQGARNFSVRDGNCVGRTLLVGQSCTLSVSFNAPRRARRFEALLSVDANAAAVIVPLTAATRAPVVRGPRLKRKRVAPGERLDLRYRLSEGALTRVLTERALPGRKAGGRCVVETRANVKRRRCTRWQRVAAVTRRDLAGRQRLRVATREKPRGVGRKRRAGAKYPVGSYRLSISALDRFRNRSDEKRVAFKLLRRRG